MELQTYSGTWTSEKYTGGISRGNVWVDLPKNVTSHIENDSERYAVEAKIQYMGMYRLRQEEKLQVIFAGKRSIVPEIITPVIHGPDGKALPSGKGQLEFTVSRVMDKKIQGTYHLSHPEDHGTFEIEPGSNHVRNCCIM